MKLYWCTGLVLIDSTMPFIIFIPTSFSIFFNLILIICGDDARNFEPRTRLKFKDIDKSIQELRRIYEAHPEWFEVPKPKSVKGKNEMNYSI
jgi:hypothetical protein